QQRDFAAFRADALRFTAEYPPGHTISVAERDGRQVFNSGAAEGAPLPPRNDLATLRTVFDTGKPYISNVFIGSLLKRPIVTVEVQIMVDGQLAYGLAFNPPLARFGEIIDAQRLPQDWVISIFDRETKHVARRPTLAGVADGVSRASPALSAELAK